jgi:putative ABC transport system permease protein
LLAVIGGGLGLLLAWRGLGLLPALGAEKLPRLQEITLDARVLGFTLLVSLLTGIAFGLAPALQALKFDLHTALKEGGRAAAFIRGRSRLRAALVVAEVALSLMLLLGAGLLIKSFWRLQQVDIGFRAERLLTLQLFLPDSTYPNGQQAAAFYEKLLERVRSLPGVKDAALTDGVPLGDWSGGTMMEVEGQPFKTGGHNTAGWHVVSPEFFRTLGARLLRGRWLEDADQERATPVTVINETLARLHWSNEDPLGRRIRISDGPQATTAFLTVVGVVADVKNDGLTEAARQEVYVPLRQRTAAIGGMGFARQMTLVVRTSAEPLNPVNAIRQEVVALDRRVPIAGVRTMEQIMTTFTAQPRFNMILLGIFAAVALVLAAVGIYGVLSYSVTQRTHEIGLRLALGAQQGDVLKLVVAQGMTSTLIGMGVGLAAALALTRLMRSLLFEVTVTDPLTFAVIAGLLTLVALIACWIPARRATKVDPIIALRHE